MGPNNKKMPAERNESINDIESDRMNLEYTADKERSNAFKTRKVRKDLVAGFLQFEFTLTIKKRIRI